MATVAVIPLKHGEYFAAVDGGILPVVALRVDEVENGCRYHPVMFDDGQFIDLAPHRVELVTRARVEGERMAADYRAKAEAKAEVRATFAPVRESERTRGRWQVGDHELTSGDVIDFPFGGQTMRGRVEHDGSSYSVIVDGFPATFLMGMIREAHYVGR